MSEQIVFDEGGVLVSTHRVVAGGQTYATANITSVRADHSMQSNASGVVWAVVTVIGAVLAALSFYGMSQCVAIFVTIMFVGFPALASLKAFQGRHSRLFLVSSASETRALTHRHPEPIDHIANAISHAIALRS